MSTPVHSDRWIRTFHPAAAPRRQLVCFPHAGGSASFFFPVSAALQSTVEVLAVQYPGRLDRYDEALVDDIGQLADAIAGALRPRLAGPPALFGHSMGAVVAFEVARRFEKRRQALQPTTEPSILIASAARAPVRCRDDGIHRRRDGGLIEEVTALEGTSAAAIVDGELMRLALPVIRNDYRAIETYVCSPGITVHCPIWVFAADRDPRISLDDARAWRAHTTGEFAMTVFPGGHFYLSDWPPGVVSQLTCALGVPG